MQTMPSTSSTSPPTCFTAITPISTTYFFSGVFRLIYRAPPSGHLFRTSLSCSTADKGPIFVSGVTGFIGSRLVYDLLSQGHTIHGTVRSFSSLSQLTTLTAHPNAANHLKLFEADILNAVSIRQALKGCTHAFHVASPFRLSARDNYRDIVRPAVDGTLNVLRTCADLGIEKVVMTSSLAAMNDGTVPTSLEHPISEHDWNTTSTVESLPYQYSKAEAERQAWKFITDSQAQTKFVCINPPVVLGPSLVPRLGQSNKLVYFLAKGPFTATTDATFPIVDVRDVSAAHIAAMFSERANGRYICCSMDCGAVHVRDLLDIVRRLGYKWPTIDLSSGIGKFMLNTVGGANANVTMRKTVAKGTRICRELGVQFRNVDSILMDTVEDLVKWGHLRPTSRQ